MSIENRLLQTWTFHLIWSAILVLSATVIWYLALTLDRPQSTLPFFATIGLIAAWRYSWWFNHQVRASIYLRREFPRLRAQADASTPHVSQVYVVVLSYNIAEEAFTRCYGSVIAAASESGIRTTIIASITRDADRRRLNGLYFEAGCPEGVEIIAQFQKGNGKRHAIGEALRAIVRDMPPKDSVTVLMDGDVVLGEGAISRVIPFFDADSDLSAVTTNNDAIVKGTELVRNWYVLRLAQRHSLMASMSLSRKLLVLTGRFSVFRTEICVSPDFIAQVEDDRVWHWRHGEIKLLTGDDKSTWFNVLKRGGKMLYLPDVMTYGMEELPAPGRLLPASTKLMQRWFGNMLRANGRAVALGPRRIGPFLWWSLVDQKLSIWTSMAGPAATVLLAVFLSPVFIVYYLAWALFVRTVMTLAVGVNYGRMSPSWPFLMYYNQIWGALVKGWLLFHLDRQSWTRQGISSSFAYSKLDRWSGSLMHAAALCLFVIAVGGVTGQLGTLRDGSVYDITRLVTGAWVAEAATPNGLDAR